MCDIQVVVGIKEQRFAIRRPTERCHCGSSNLRGWLPRLSDPPPGALSQGPGRPGEPGPQIPIRRLDGDQRSRQGGRHCGRGANQVQIVRVASLYEVGSLNASRQRPSTVHQLLHPTLHQTHYLSPGDYSVLPRTANKLHHTSQSRPIVD